MKTTALIEKGKDGTFGVFTPDLNHTIIGAGNSVAEAKQDFENSVQEMLAAYAERGIELPTELMDLKFEYKYDISSLFNYYNFINVTKFAEVAGINASLMRQYKAGNHYISETQIQKIEAAFHKVANEFAGIRLI